MGHLSTREFAELTRKSRLVSTGELKKAIDRVKSANHGHLPSDHQPLAKQLIGDQLLTDWQYEKLLAGKYRGFFLGKYRLLSLLGAGGMGAVYLANHDAMQRQVAIKVLSSKRLNEPTYLERFYREARSVAALDHNNIIRAYDVDRDGDTHFFVMEYVPGIDLRKRVRSADQPLPIDVVVDYIRQAARGLQHAHAMGLIHRDVKPANLLINDQGTVKILDLGLARIADDDGSITEDHDQRVMGTADYLAPEQAINSHAVDARADIYGLGCTLFFAVTGRPPFCEGTLAQRIACHQTLKPPWLPDLRTDCPQQLARICQEMLQKSPDDRISSAAELIHQLDTCLDSSSSDDWPGIQTDPAPNSPRRDRRTKVTRSTSPARNRRRAKSRGQLPLAFWAICWLLCVAAAYLTYLIFFK